MSSVHYKTTKPYGTLPPNAQVQPEPFTLRIPDYEIEELRRLLELAKIGPKTWENQQNDGRFGVSYNWLANARDYWRSKFNWRLIEQHVNSFPNYTISIKDGHDRDIMMHFTALFSEQPDAAPIVLMHGWPGSFMDYLPILSRLANKYLPADLPYHIIVPSIPGYAMSTIPEDSEFTIDDAARVIHNLMVTLGFGSGYIAQGGDIGSVLALILAMQYPECKAAHRNPPADDTEGISEDSRERLNRIKLFLQTGYAYSAEHITRPSTIGFVLSSNPLSLLAWIAEKFLEWSDVSLPLDTILGSVTLYWFTSTFPRGLYPYRTIDPTLIRHHPPPFQKPLGFSSFLMDLIPTPKSWLDGLSNLVWFRQRNKGAHFPALEQPDELLQDIEDFIGECITRNFTVPESLATE
ncbi:epoxide hydrolase family protein [Aspergillus tanneri]|uniref:Epoxide hydrolase N-terminal domain-containing protein n=1 Tax=Aspergillus tanneri TaxID=1220188 RepID=A0A5M9MX64_9EURO|nr:uncharacterized protein ATNIH1004_000598 [Aspergillus tanneri]KAA8651702.1 hypothetical protein ATNIH1004_000598 [Aspergillus tanneri]